MKTYDQTNLDPATGNCMSACLATVLQIDLEEIPNFFEVMIDGDWWGAVNLWLASRGYGLFTIGYSRPKHNEQYLSTHLGMVIVGGPTNRGTEHAVVYKDGVLFHDPHPSRAGLLKVSGIDIIYPLNPADWVLKKKADEC